MPKQLNNIDDLHTELGKDIFNNKMPWIKFDDPDNPKWDDVEHLRLQWKITLPIQECYPSSQSIHSYTKVFHH